MARSRAAPSLVDVSTPTVEVHLFAAARAAVGASVLVVPAATLTGLLDAMTDGYPAFAAVRPKCSYLVDGTAVHGDLGEIAVAPGSRVDVLPPFAGG